MLRSAMRLSALCAALLFGLLGQIRVKAEELRDKLQQHVENLAEQNGFSGAVLVTKDGQPLLRAAYGKANYELDVPNTPETKFRLGSITKQFTAMATMILAERSKLSID